MSVGLETVRISGHVGLAVQRSIDCRFEL